MFSCCLKWVLPWGKKGSARESEGIGGEKGMKVEETDHHDEGSLGLADLLNRVRDDLVHKASEWNRRESRVSVRLSGRKRGQKGPRKKLVAPSFDA